MQGKLNEKEARVAMLLARTGNAKEVAKTLKKGEQSVKNLLRDIYKKLGIQTGFKSVILGRAALRELMELSARKGRVFKDYPPPASVSFFLDEDEVSFAYSVAEGLSNEALARQFSTGVKEIKAAVKKTYDKLGVSGRLEFSLRVCQEQYYEERAALRRSA